LFDRHDGEHNFQEGTSVKIKSLAVIAILVLGCSAALAQNSYSFGFLSASGVGEYCNYESFTTGGHDNFFLQGYDVLSACPYEPNAGVNASIEGLAISVPTSAFTPLHGKAYVYADQEIDAYYGAYTGEQWMVVTKTAVNASNNFDNRNWVGYIGIVGYEFLGNYGFLSNTIPEVGKANVMRKSTSSAFNPANKAQINKGLKTIQ
jgi:hypothetical protein